MTSWYDAIGSVNSLHTVQYHETIASSDPCVISPLSIKQHSPGYYSDCDTLADKHELRRCESIQDMVFYGTTAQTQPQTIYMVGGKVRLRRYNTLERQILPVC